MKQLAQKLAHFPIWGLEALLILMPFHAFLVIFLGSRIGSNSVVAIWKELLIAAIAIAVCVTVEKKDLIKLDILNIVTLTIIGLSLIVSIFNPLDLRQFLFGVKTDLVALVLFLAAQTQAKRIKRQRLHELILFPAFVVAALAIAQSYFVPIRLLAMLGYNSSNIAPVQLVDPAVNAIRVFSTLGGPNQLGAYLILPLCLCLVIIIRKRDYRYILGFFTLASGIYLTFSRSAWIGAAIAVVLAIFFSVGKKVKLAVAAISILVALIFSIKIYQIVTTNKTTTLQHTLLHGRHAFGYVEGSDKGRISSLKNGANYAIDTPLGNGLGSAGPASYQGKHTIITENWYLQIAIEVGVFGLILWLVFWALNIIGLLKKTSAEKQMLNIALASAIIGLLFTNLFLHSFADSTLIIILAICAGLARRDK